MTTALRLWIDKGVEPPDDSWDWVTTSEAAVALLRFFEENESGGAPLGLDAISFGDLTGDDTCVKVVKWMREHQIGFREWRVHSLDAKEIKNIVAAVG